MMFRMMLKSTVNWAKLNMKVVSDVSNGADGWTAYQQVKPDIVITDLRMPVMDGLDFIVKIRESDEQQSKIVVLTCLDDFDMVRTALKYGVSDYILKLTMTPDEIDSVLNRLVKELEKEGRTIQTDAQMEWDRDVQKEILIKDYLFRRRYFVEEFTGKAEELQLRLQPSKGIAGVMMEIDHFELLQEKFKDLKGQIIKMSLLNVLEEIMSGFRRGESIHDSDSRYFILANCAKVEELFPLLEHIKKVMKTYFNMTVTFGISSLHIGFERLKSVYTECSTALEQKFFRGLGTLNEYKTSDSKDSHLSSYLLNGGDQDWLTSDSRRKILYDKLRQIGGFRSEERQQVIWLFMQGLHRITYSLRLTGDAVSELVYTYTELMAKSETLEELFAFFEAFVEEIHRLRSRNQMSKEVSRVMEWMEEHYKESVDLHQAAEKVNLSYNHLSMLFKKEAGISFSDYLQQIRIEKAKELLLKSDKKLYDIMEEAGFTDQSYFSRLFKKVVGVRPSEFKKSWAKEV